MVTAVDTLEPPEGPPLLPWLTQPLAEALQRRTPHALLVHGPQGVGQVDLAMALAQAWLCETPREQRATSGAACQHCASCRLARAHSHPDLRVIVPEAHRAELGLPDDDRGDDDKKRKPSREIRVEQVRAALHFSELTAGRGNLKVVVIHPAEALNDVSSNALLKTLEEPSGHLRFVLCSGAPASLLPTIRSRCQALPLALPSADDAIAWLRTHGVEAPEAVLAFSGGQPLLALAHHRAGRDGPQWQGLPRAVEAGDAAAMAGWPVSLVVDALAKLCHDRAACLLGAPPRFFPHWTPAGQASLDDVTRCAADLRQAARQADHPWHAGLAVEALVMRVQAAIGHGRSRSASAARPPRPVNSRQPASPS